MTTGNERKRILIVAGETSGDMYAAALVDELERLGDFEIFAVGGPQTARRKVQLLYNSSDWAVIGYVEAIKRAPQLYLVLRDLKRFLEQRRPHLVLLLDYPGFNMRLAKHAKSLGIPTLHYFPPSKFATTPEEVADAASTLTCVAANFTFTYENYKAAKANVHFVGHPLVDLARPTMSREEAFRTFGLDASRPVVGLCPGSRKSELVELLPVMLDAARLMLKRMPDLQFLVPIIATTSSDVYGIPKSDLQAQIAASGLPVSIAEGRIYDVMAVSRLLLISSGTATLEASRVGTPMIIVYKVSIFTEIVARLFNKIPPFIGLPNIILGRQACPEMIQRSLSAEALAEKAIALLSDAAALERQKQDLAEVISHLGPSGANAHVARLALDLLNNPPRI